MSLNIRAHWRIKIVGDTETLLRWFISRFVVSKLSLFCCCPRLCSLVFLLLCMRSHFPLSLLWRSYAFVHNFVCMIQTKTRRWWSMCCHMLTATDSMLPRLLTLFLFLFRALLFLHTRNAQTRTRTSRERTRTPNMPGTDRIISLICPTCVLSKGLLVSIRLRYSYMHCKYGCIYGFRVGKIQKLNQLCLIYIIQVSFYSCVCTFAIV